MSDTNENLTKVIPRENGYCAGYQLVKGKEIALPERVLDALGEDAYDEVREARPPKVKNKQVTGAANKQVTDADNK